MADNDSIRQHHNVMLNELAVKIKPGTILFTKFKLHVIGAFLSQSVVSKCHDTVAIINQLEQADHVQPGHYDVLLNIFRDIGCKIPSIFNVIKECGTTINQGKHLRTANDEDRSLYSAAGSSVPTFTEERISPTAETTEARLPSFDHFESAQKSNTGARGASRQPSETDSTEGNDQVSSHQRNPGYTTTIIGDGNMIIKKKTVHVTRTNSDIPKSLKAFFKNYESESIRFARDEFEETRGAKKALYMVYVKKIVSIIGSPGGGKSSIVKWIISNLLVHGYEVIVVRSIRDWRQYVDPTRKQIVIIEDIFGSSQFDLHSCKAWLDLIQEIQLALDFGEIFVVITSRKSHYTEASLNRSHKPFCNVIDLNNEVCKLTKQEMMNILNRQLSLNKRATISNEDETVTFVDNGVIGFPECCRIFCTEGRFHAMGLDFFENPSICLKELLVSMSKHMPGKFSALVYCMLHGGAIPTRCCAVTGKCSKLDIALKSCGLRVDESVKAVVDQMEILLNSFVVLGDNEVAYKIQHQSLLDAIVGVFCNECRGHDVIIQHADLVFIANNVLINDWEGSHRNSIPFNSKHFEMLWSRLMKELSTDSLVNLVFEGLLLKHEGFVSFYVNQLINENKLIWFLEQNSSVILKSNLHEHSTKVGWHNMTLIKEITNPEVVDHILENAIGDRRQLIFYILLWSSVVCNNHEVTLKLVSEYLNPNITSTHGITPIHCAVQEGSAATVHKLLRKGFSQEATETVKNTPMHIAARLGRKDMVDLLIKHGARLEDVNSSMFTAIHIAAQNGQTDTVQLLLEHGANISAIDGSNYTPLHWASRYGHTDTVRLLLDHRADHAAVHENWYTPLHWACQNGHTDAARLLLERGARLDAANRWGSTPLHRACHSGHVDVVKMLLDQGANIAAAGQFGRAPIHVAAESGHTDVMKFLLDRGADIAAVTVSRYTPLHIACQNGHTEAAQLLLARSPKHDIKDKWGRTPLHRACWRGHTDTAELLLTSGAKHDIKDNWDNTPLHRACQFDHVTTVKMLVNLGADIDVSGLDGRSPLHTASEFGSTDTVSLLVKCGADTSSADDAGYTPLHWASQNGHTNTMSRLISRGATIGINDKWGGTPMHRASQYGRTAATRLLLKHGADHANVDDNLCTPLHMASQNGHLCTVRLLLKLGSSVDAADKWGNTPLHSTCEKGHTDIAKLLLEHEAGLSTVNHWGFAPLHRATRFGHTDLLQLLLDRGADHTTVDKEGYTPLQHAYAMKRPVIIWQLEQHIARLS